MTQRFWLAGCLLLVLFLLAACAVPPRIGADIAGARNIADAFARTGRFALTAQTFDAPPQATQGGFAWHDDGRTLRVHLANPVGTVLAQLRVEPDRAVLRRSDGSEETAQDADALAARVLGRAVPVSNLRAWLRGQATPHAADMQRDAAGHLAALMQDGWHVQLSRFDARGPRLLRLTRSDAGEQVQLRLVIDGD